VFEIAIPLYQNGGEEVKELASRGTAAGRNTSGYGVNADRRK
jgi:hypothetical protein